MLYLKIKYKLHQPAFSAKRSFPKQKTAQKSLTLTDNDFGIDTTLFRKIERYLYPLIFRNHTIIVYI